MKKSISQKMLQTLVILAIFIIIAASVTVGIQSWFNTVSTYTEHAYAISDAAAEFIDGERLLQYYEGAPLDEYYDEIQRYMDSMGGTPSVKYFYVIIPEKDSIVYVWDAHINEDYDVLGDTEIYAVGEYETMMARMNGTGPRKIKIYNTDEYGFLATSYSVIKDGSGNGIALAAVDISMPHVIRDLMSYMLAVAFGTIVVTVIALSVYLYYIRKNIISPLAELSNSTREMVQKLEIDENSEISIHSGDEFEALAESFNSMNRELREYIVRLGKIMAEKERIGAELNVATQIQTDMLPTIFPPFPDIPSIDLYATMDPAKEVGGDFYDFYEIGENKIGLIIADVSGKGVPAALFMVIAKTLIKNYALQDYSPKDILAMTNNQLCEGNKAELFVTVWIAIIDINTGEGVAANAGHEHPALKKADGDYELIKYKHSVAVAVMDGMVFKEHEFKLDAGDTLFVYTDGVTEATDANDCLFGEERLLASLNEHKDLDATELLGAVREDIDQFVGDAPQFDDLTMMAFTYKGQQ